MVTYGTGNFPDLGKVLLLPSFGGLPQWAVVGDTHPLGCAFDESIVHHKVFEIYIMEQIYYFCFSLVTKPFGQMYTHSLICIDTVFS